MAKSASPSSIAPERYETPSPNTFALPLLTSIRHPAIIPPTTPHQHSLERYMTRTPQSFPLPLPPTTSPTTPPTTPREHESVAHPNSARSHNPSHMSKLSTLETASRVRRIASATSLQASAGCPSTPSSRFYSLSSPCSQAPTRTHPQISTPRYRPPPAPPPPPPPPPGLDPIRARVNKPGRPFGSGDPN